ncbi:MAG: O-antigen ligase family protein [Armatimonadota bacterium]|nr:O-antigen ligase family protein [Armatimonadota bacterium]
MTAPQMERLCYAATLVAVFAYSSGYAGWVLPVLLVLSLGAVLAGRRRWIPTTLDRPMVALLAAALASGLASEWRGESVGLATLFAAAVLGTVFTVGLALRVGRAAVGAIAWAWIAGGLAAAVWGMARSGTWPVAASTPAVGPTGLGTTLAAAYALTLGTWTVASGWAQRGLIAFGLPVLAAALELTGSRGAWIGAAAAAVVLIAVAPRARTALVVLCLASVVLATLAIGHKREPLAGRLGSIPSLEANVDRWDLWRSVPKIVRDHPALGSGYGTFTRIWPRYSPDPRYGEKPTAHNVYLNFAAETGLLGLAAFLAFVGAGLGGLWRRLGQHRGDGRTDGLWAGFFAAAVAILTHQLFDATVMSWHTGYGVIALFALGGSRDE